MNRHPGHILIGRPAAKAVSLKAALEEQGARVTCIPLIEIRQHPNPAQIEVPRQVDIVVITSQNAVNAYVTLKDKLSSHVLAAVGDKTAQALHAGGAPPRVVGSGKGAFDLLDQLSTLHPMAGATLLYLGSNLVNSEFAKRAREIGATVHFVPVYENVMPPGLTAEILRGFDTAVFYSSSAAEHFFSLVTPREAADMMAVAIGQSTAVSLRNLGVRYISVASSPDTEGLLCAIIQQSTKQTELSDDFSHREA